MPGRLSSRQHAYHPGIALTERLPGNRRRFRGSFPRLLVRIKSRVATADERLPRANTVPMVSTDFNDLLDVNTGVHIKLEMFRAILSNFRAGASTLTRSRPHLPRLKDFPQLPAVSFVTISLRFHYTFPTSRGTVPRARDS